MRFDAGICRRVSAIDRPGLPVDLGFTAQVQTATAKPLLLGLRRMSAARTSAEAGKRQSPSVAGGSFAGVAHSNPDPWIY
jgi:hypothetical protein